MESDEPDPDSDLVLAIALVAQHHAAKEAATWEEGKYVPFNCRLILTLCKKCKSVKSQKSWFQVGE